MKQTTFSLVTGETVTQVIHPSGLTILVYPKKGFRSAYALFGTRYGSVDTVFERDGKRIEVPAGIAHYLEHKLFENEDCDAFVRYAATGANANAFTSFDQTAYLFSCSDHFEESLEILLDFVQKPYFTEQTVQKEQGIIGQEIRMGDDDPDRRVLFNMLRAMYVVNPVRVDIAGTVESISHITPELLYDCYYTFYNLHNMVLAVAGGVTVEQVLAVADRMLQPAKPLQLDMPLPDEPEAAGDSRIEDTMPVAAPLFCLGFKCPMTASYLSAKDQLAAQIITRVLSSSSSPLYTALMEKGLINDSFGGTFFDGRGFAMFLFEGESGEPEAVEAALLTEIDALRQSGVDAERFAELKLALYGRLLRQLNAAETGAMMLMDNYFCGRRPGEVIDACMALTPEDIDERLQRWLRPEQRTLSIVRGE
ncbi:MAG: insulinase family protein [Clostridia bacterium]|nr:insulinase family protein [Clostridia bacterium]